MDPTRPSCSTSQPSMSSMSAVSPEQRIAETFSEYSPREHNSFEPSAMNELILRYEQSVQERHERHEKMQRVLKPILNAAELTRKEPPAESLPQEVIEYEILPLPQEVIEYEILPFLGISDDLNEVLTTSSALAICAYNHIENVQSEIESLTQTDPDIKRAWDEINADAAPQASRGIQSLSEDTVSDGDAASIPSPNWPPDFKSFLKKITVNKRQSELYKLLPQPYTMPANEIRLARATELARQVRFAGLEARVDWDFWCDPDYVLKLVERDGLKLRSASSILQADRLIVETAVKNNGLALEFAIPELQDDLKIVTYAVANAGLALQFASDRLRNNLDVAKLAISRDRLAMGCVAADLRNSEDFIREYIAQYGCGWNYAGPQLRDNLAFMRDALRHDKYILKYASARLKDDYEFVMMAVSKAWQTFADASERLRDNKAIARIAVWQSTNALQYIPSDELRNALYQERREAEFGYCIIL